METSVLNPTEILTKAGVTESTVIADFGCGPGIFALPAAQLTQATVHCFDILPTALEAIISKARTMNIVNIAPKRVNLEAVEGSTLAPQSVDLVIMRKILCQHQDNKRLFDEAQRILRAEGTVLVVGWTPEATIGPEPHDRIDKDDITTLATTAGFENVEEIPCDAQHYALAFSR